MCPPSRQKLSHKRRLEKFPYMKFDFSCCSWDPCNHQQVNVSRLTCYIMREKESGHPCHWMWQFSQLSANTRRTSNQYQQKNCLAEPSPNWGFLLETWEVWYILRVYLSPRMKLFLSECSALNPFLHTTLGISQPPLSLLTSLHYYDGSRYWKTSLEEGDAWPFYPLIQRVVCYLWISV